jgi:hypothetical protein
MTNPDSQGRYQLLCELYRAGGRRAPHDDYTPADRGLWEEFLRSPDALRLALNRAIVAEGKLRVLEGKAAAWDALSKIADHSAVSDVELSGDMNGPNKWIAIAGLLEGSFIEGLQAETPEQAVTNLAETFAQWHRDTFESCLEDG